LDHKPCAITSLEKRTKQISNPAPATKFTQPLTIETGPRIGAVYVPESAGFLVGRTRIDEKQVG